MKHEVASAAPTRTNNKNKKLSAVWVRLNSKSGGGGGGPYSEWTDAGRGDGTLDNVDHHHRRNELNMVHSTSTTHNAPDGTIRMGQPYVRLGVKLAQPLPRWKQGPIETEVWIHQHHGGKRTCWGSGEPQQQHMPGKGGGTSPHKPAEDDGYRYEHTNLGQLHENSHEAGFHNSTTSTGVPGGLQRQGPHGMMGPLDAATWEHDDGSNSSTSHGKSPWEPVGRLSEVRDKLSSSIPQGPPRLSTSCWRPRSMMRGYGVPIKTTQYLRLSSKRHGPGEDVGPQYGAASAPQLREGQRKPPSFNEPDSECGPRWGLG
ncbi:AT-rich interactive domain-containing protein 1B-like isoform X1 [Lates japonicus]|uniref:AT-rich interactive domain-containing protein 1B-like isoform X1 n=1 Tax=Lates japonicus TaxID=270547 RepID=A0AAD3NAC7_LATJO|nr:AT-rich interactive domain-containing protein 1B-like isoform X1 [Lates japonicus]